MLYRMRDRAHAAAQRQIGFSIVLVVLLVGFSGCARTDQRVTGRVSATNTPTLVVYATQDPTLPPGSPILHRDTGAWLPFTYSTGIFSGEYAADWTSAPPQMNTMIFNSAYTPSPMLPAPPIQASITAFTDAGAIARLCAAHPSDVIAGLPASTYTVGDARYNTRVWEGANKTIGLQVSFSVLIQAGRLEDYQPIYAHFAHAIHVAQGYAHTGPCSQ